MPVGELMPEIDPKLRRELASIARLLKLAPLQDGGIESSINYRCRSRACKRPRRCKVKHCKRDGACRLAALAGWPWPMPGLQPGDTGYSMALSDRFTDLRRSRS